MKIALYGLPCAGKTSLMSELSGVRVVNGSKELNRLSGNLFSALAEEDKKIIREKYAEYIGSLDEEIIISDGHYSFLDNVVFTDSDGDTYDVFIYLYVKSDVIATRIRNSDKNSKYAYLPVADIEQWQQTEIECLREECHSRNKDFYVIKGDEITSTDFMDFITSIKQGYGSYQLAVELTNKIISVYPTPCKICLVDGDKTIIKQDTFRFCGNGKTSIFDGSFYTGYQSLLFANETQRYICDYSKIDELELNSIVSDRINIRSTIVLSSGITELWDKVSNRFGFAMVLANPLISADTKYYVVKLLRKKGYYITAYGDSKNDLYMLREADKGYLCIGDKISKSLSNSSICGVSLIYDKSPFILADCSDATVSRDISICKSNSGINGSQLAAAHIRLGQGLGEEMKVLIPNKETAVLVLERGGRFFGDGVYSSFGGIFYPFNPSSDTVPDLSKHSIITIVDSVVNTGKSILKLITELKYQNKDSEIFIAANVIQRKALSILSDYKIFTVRISDNYFIGRSQKHQTGELGPDTADRLFNLI